MTKVFYFGENWILTLKLTVRRGWYITKSRQHPNTLAVASWTWHISAQTDLEDDAQVSPQQFSHQGKRKRVPRSRDKEKKTPTKHPAAKGAH